MIISLAPTHFEITVVIPKLIANPGRTENTAIA